MKIPKPYTTSFKLGCPLLSATRDREYGYRMGHIMTLHGVVGLYDQAANSRTEALTILDIVIDGRVHRATWERDFSDRYLKTLATRFAADLTGAHP